MKNLIINTFGFLIFMSPQYLTAATTIMEVTYSVFLNTASNTYPSVNFGQGTPAKFKFEYDPATSPYFSGKVITDSNGDPIFVNNDIVYDTSVPPGSLMSNESQYSIIGNVTLEIDNQLWSGSSFNLIVYNNFPTLTPIDGFLFEFNLTPNSPFAEPLHSVQLRFTSNSSPLSLIQNTALPTQNSDIDRSNLESGGFGLRPEGGGWVINSGSLTTISVTTIPEISSLFLIGITFMFVTSRRSRG